jgi:hypothetical protein
MSRSDGVAAPGDCRWPCSGGHRPHCFLGRLCPPSLTSTACAAATQLLTQHSDLQEGSTAFDARDAQHCSDVTCIAWVEVWRLAAAQRVVGKHLRKEVVIYGYDVQHAVVAGRRYLRRLAVRRWQQKCAWTLVCCCLEHKSQKCHVMLNESVSPLKCAHCALACTLLPAGKQGY